MVLADPPAPDVVGFRFGLELKDDPARESQIDFPWVFFSFAFLAIMFSICPQANSTLNQPAFSVELLKPFTKHVRGDQKPQFCGLMQAEMRSHVGSTAQLQQQLAQPRFGRSMHRWKIATCASDQIL